MGQFIAYVGKRVPEMARAVGKQQKPYEHIEGVASLDIVLVVVPDAAGPPSPKTQIAPSVSPQAIELTFWDTIKSSNNPEDFKAYLNKYPKAAMTIPRRPAGEDGYAIHEEGT
jgi:hypothetical protein